MDQPFLRLLIQEKLADGRLPRAPIPRVWGGPGHGETCDGCGEIVTNAQTVMENLDDRRAAGSSCTSHAFTSGTSSVRFRDASRASVFRPDPGSELPAPVRAGHGHQPRRQPGRAPRHRDARVGERTGAVRAGPVRAGPAPRQALRGPFVAVPPARNPRSDVPGLPQPRRRRTGSRHGHRHGDSVRLPLPHVRHGIRPRLLDAADDRDGLEHARRSLSAESPRHSADPRHPVCSLTVSRCPATMALDSRLSRRARKPL